MRLRGAETNLERLDDVIAGLTEQRDYFANRRVRPAVRSRTVFARPTQLLLANGQPARQVRRSRLICTASGSALPKKPRQRRKARQAGQIAATLPPLRGRSCAAEYQRLSIGQNELDREEERIRDARERLQTQQEQIGRDMARETDLRDDATAANSRLGEEIIELQKQIDEATPKRETANLELEVARESARLADAALAEAV